MHPTVREFYGRTGRDLLGSVAASCPRIISTLLARVSLTIDETGMVGSLIRDLHMHHAISTKVSDCIWLLFTVQLSGDYDNDDFVLQD